MLRAAAQATGYSSSRYWRTLSVDDSTVGFADTDTALNSGGAVTTEADFAFDATPAAPSGGAMTMTATATAAARTIKRFAIHDDTTTNVTTSSTTLMMGVDGFSLTQTVDFSITFTSVVTVTSV